MSFARLPISLQRFAQHDRLNRLSLLLIVCLICVNLRNLWITCIHAAANLRELS